MRNALRRFLMRAFLPLCLVFCLVFLPFGSAQAQAPRGVEPIPGYTGLYVADANKFMAGAFVFFMIPRPRDVRAFLAQVKTCTSDPQLARQLRNERLRTTVISFRTVFTALAAGDCDVFIGTNFDLAQLNKRLNSNAIGANFNMLLKAMRQMIVGNQR